MVRAGTVLELQVQHGSILYPAGPGTKVGSGDKGDLYQQPFISRCGLPAPLSKKTVTPQDTHMGLEMKSCCQLSGDAFLRITQRRPWLASARLSLKLQMANGTLLPGPCSLAWLLLHSLTIMLVQKLVLEPALTRHSREGKAEGKLARWKAGAIYFMLAPAAWRVL